MYAFRPCFSPSLFLYKNSSVCRESGTCFCGHFVIASHQNMTLTVSKHLVWGAPYYLIKEDNVHWDKDICSITQHWFILWESHLNFASNDNLLKHNVTIMWWRNKVHNAALLGRMSMKLTFFCLYLTDHHGEFKLCTNSFNPHVTVIQSLRMHLSQILIAVSKPIN